MKDILLANTLFFVKKVAEYRCVRMLRVQLPLQSVQLM